MIQHLKKGIFGYFKEIFSTKILFPEISQAVSNAKRKKNLS